MVPSESVLEEVMDEKDEEESSSSPLKSIQTVVTLGGLQSALGPCWCTRYYTIDTTGYLLGVVV